MKAYGSQILAELMGCQAELLNHKEQLESLLAEGIERYQLVLKSLTSYQFEPVGVTAIAIIGASHVAIHTYPEMGHLSLDIFTCEPGSEGPRQLMYFLKERLQAETLRFKELARGVGIEVLHKDYISDFTLSGFHIRYQIEKLLLNQRTPYQQLTIIDNREFGRMLFLDNELQIAAYDAQLYNQALVEPLVKHFQQLGRPMEKVAILGGGDGGVLKAVLASEVKQVTLVDIDAEVVQAAQQHLVEICGQAFADPRLELKIGDACEFMEAAQGYDAVIYDLTMTPDHLNPQVDAQDQVKDQVEEQPQARALPTADFFPRLFAGIQRSLKPDGMLTMQVGSRFDPKVRLQAERLLSRHFTQIQFSEVYIPSFCEGWIFAQAHQSC